jgi:hypothetical protein
MPKYVSNAVAVPGDGAPCPRCGQMMQIYQHREISARQRHAPFYYAKWFRCYNVGCRTTTVMPDRYRVWNITGQKRLDLERWLAEHVYERD